MTDAKLTQQQQGARLPMARTDADIDALTHLTDAEKAVAKKNQKRVPPSDGWFLLGNDPELQAIARIDEIASIVLLEPDTQMIPGGPMNLMCLIVARHFGNEWMFAAMAKVAVNMAKATGQKDFDPVQFGMLDFPDSMIWTDVQRLTIKFTHACLNNTMTDELFEQAREIWGEKRILRYIRWMSYVQFWAMVQNACNLKWVPTVGVGEKQTVLPPDPKERLDFDEKVKDGLLSLWDSMATAAFMA
ncbi:MAG: hypothetical protein HKP58_18295 [Desulfatitalea sp.]|nr:hypothetical protein [Desulfatitalea sp.]NNK02367.1 hypothetical protein [Desulfatitalea sp.]